MWKIKLLGLVVLLIGVSGCESKFPSRTQAIEECNEWEDKEVVVTYKIKTGEKTTYGWFPEPEPPKLSRQKFCMLKDDCRWAELPNPEHMDWIKRRNKFAKRTTTPIYGTKTNRSRRCKEEKETNQILGYENQAIVDGTWKDELGKKGEFEIVKHFRW